MTPTERSAAIRDGFTWRERLADWISGGKLTKARVALRLVMESEQRSEASHRAANVRFDRETELRITRAKRLTGALSRILAATEHGKSGTAQKVARMAREALE